MNWAMPWRFGYYGYRPWITLYAFGGLASYNPEEEFGYDPVFVLGEHLRRYRNTRRDVIIALAGPAAGFLFAGLIVGGIWLSNAADLLRLGFGRRTFGAVANPRRCERGPRTDAPVSALHQYLLGHGQSAADLAARMAGRLPARC